MISRQKLISVLAATAALGGASVASTSPAQAWCGYHSCGYGYSDGALAAGIIGGLAVGAIAASAAHQAAAEDRRAARAAYAAQNRRGVRKVRHAR